MQALGGAKNHMVVMPDADIEQAVDALIGSAYGSAGEALHGDLSVAVLVGDVADKIVPSWPNAPKALKIKNPMDWTPRWGRSSRAAGERSASRATSASACEGGRKLVVDGRGQRCRAWTGGFFTGGTLFDHVTPTDAHLPSEEIFGPVLSPACAWTRLDEAVQLVNEPRVRQRRGLLHQRRRRGARVQRRVQVGMVGINVPDPRADGLARLRRLEEEPVRRHARLRRRGRALLHQAEERDAALAESIAKGAEFVMPTAK